MSEPDTTETTLTAPTRALANRHSDEGNNATNYRVVLATSIPELKESYHRACRAVWGASHPLKSFSMYMNAQREKTEWAGSGKQQIWCLVRTSPHTGDAVTVLSGCSTTLVRVLIKSKGEQEIRLGCMYSLGHNVTPTNHRSKGFNWRLLQGVTRTLAPKSAFMDCPASWQAEAELTEAQRAQIPRGEGSYLWSDIDASFYWRSVFGRDGPGWKAEPDALKEMTWNTRPPTSTRSMDQVASEHGWDILRRRDWPAIVATLREASLSTLEQADSSQCTLVLVDPGAPGVFSWRHQLNESVVHLVPRLQSVDFEEEPIGLLKGKAMTLLSRWDVGRSNSIQVTRTYRLRAEDVPSWAEVLDVMGSETSAQQVMVYDLDAQSAVGKALQNTREAKVGTARGVKRSPLMKVYYPGLSSGDHGRILDEQRQIWV